MVENTVISTHDLSIASPFEQIQPYALNISQFSHLPGDVLLNIAEFLDLRSLITLRTVSRLLYLTLPNKTVFNKIYLTNNVSPIQFDKLLIFLESIKATQFIRQVTFYEMTITHESLISVLTRCENLRHISVYGGKNVKLRKITKSLVKWQQENSNDSPKLEHFKSLVLTRCVGGPRRNYPAQKVNQDLQILKKHIIKLAECDDLSCELCTKRCDHCGIQYQFWDYYWITCSWCKKRNFCGVCVYNVSQNNVNARNGYFRMSMCQMFGMPCF
ncbi:9252_t:CDS:1 [Ambispora gerdemannii]|uniref:9252_t:CDS:1 n=1 Tax=Ambispora gerdemannii TaxID=144530 RepID=A0A9N9B570_9GLOM|nr:9252_t:CDS:1 [Ambispora gerdemannii]